jgi:hypothetical protein
VTPDISASSICCGEMKWMWLSKPPAVMILPSPADIGFDDAPMIEDQCIGDDGVDGALFVGDLALPHAVANDFAAAEFHLFAVDGEIFLDLDNEIGVGKPHAVARRRAEHIGVNAAAYACWHDGFFLLFDRFAGFIADWPSSYLLRRKSPVLSPLYSAVWFYTLLLASEPPGDILTLRSLAFGSPDERGRQDRVGPGRRSRYQRRAKLPIDFGPSRGSSAENVTGRLAQAGPS